MLDLGFPGELLKASNLKCSCAPALEPQSLLPCCTQSTVGRSLIILILLTLFTQVFMGGLRVPGSVQGTAGRAPLTSEGVQSMGRQIVSG